MNILVKEVFGVQTDVTGSCRTEEGRVKPDTKNRISRETMTCSGRKGRAHGQLCGHHVWRDIEWLYLEP